MFMMMNYEGDGVVVLWWLVLGGKSPFECGSSGTNGGMEYLLFFVSHFSRARYHIVMRFLGVCRGIFAQG